VDAALEAGIRTGDLGGTASTTEFTDAVLAKLNTWNATPGVALPGIGRASHGDPSLRSG
jgi:hypothetical protein